MFVGYQAVYDQSYKDAIDYAAQSGFDYVQFNLRVPRFYLDKMSKSQIIELRDRARDRGVGLALLAMGEDMSLYSDHSPIRKGILEYLTAVVEKAEMLEARHLTVRLADHPTFKKATASTGDFALEYGEYYGRVLHENLSQLAAATGGVMLCVAASSMSTVAKATLDRMFKEASPIYLVWDIASIYKDGAAEKYLSERVSHVRELHIYDLAKGSKSNQIVGDGAIDFYRFRHLFSYPNIATTILVRPRENAETSRKRLIRILESPTEGSA
jgi:sugar phosphate isomerase/epimerase